MAETTHEDELAAEFSQFSRRLSRALAQGQRLRVAAGRRSARDIVARIPQRNRQTLLAGVRWAAADASRHRDPAGARRLDDEMRRRGYHPDGTRPTQPGPRPDVDTDLAAALDERTAQLAASREELDAARARLDDQNTQIGDLRAQLAAERDRDGLSPVAAAGVLAAAELVDALDHEAINRIDQLDPSPAQDTTLAADHTADQMLGAEAVDDHGPDVVTERTADVGQLLDAASGRDLVDILTTSGSHSPEPSNLAQMSQNLEVGQGVDTGLGR